ncbi:hypothetical protein EJ03DRAFT_56004 [Teratosphaeria nubilosa]|uniref:Secreted protein n=1 Tax=Teratosphaeria nubilosa TaxID=161662 RepID=A0A6G1LE24_9PEZI|nr:hypothetical protein EJ03DRAFT_56004 [Teratosphaeria nubilosa]
MRWALVVGPAPLVLSGSFRSLLSVLSARTSWMCMSIPAGSARRLSSWRGGHVLALIHMSCEKFTKSHTSAIQPWTPTQTSPTRNLTRANRHRPYITCLPSSIKRTHLRPRPRCTSKPSSSPSLPPQQQPADRNTSAANASTLALGT